MKQFYFPLLILVLSFLFILSIVNSTSVEAQDLPEYNNSAIAWNSKTNTSVQLTPEEGVKKTKMNSAYSVPYGSLFSKKPAMKSGTQFNGPKSKARIAFEDTLKIFVKIDKDIDPKSVIKIYRATVENDNREVNVMQVSKKGEIKYSDGDYSYTVRKMSPGVFRVDVTGVKTGNELFFYIGTHDAALAKLTLGID